MLKFQDIPEIIGTETLPIIVLQHIGVATPKTWRLSFFAFAFALLASCSLEPAALRPIRAHVVDKQGVAHAEPAIKAARYCQVCHGQALQGGSLGEPSCLQCHGVRWQESDPNLSLAPSDHTAEHGGFRHHPDFATPYQTCITCHGADLQGQLDEGTPSCYLCHDQKWTD